AVHRAASRLRADGLDGTVVAKPERERYGGGPIAHRRTGGARVDWSPTNSLAREQCSRIPRRLGEEAHELPFGHLGCAALVGHDEEAEDRGAQDSLAGDVRIVHAHR